MAEKLNDESIDGWLKNRKGWKRSGDSLAKAFDFQSFRDAIVFVNRVASLADELGHHPDIDIRYTTVLLTLSTHSSSGVTELDLKLAERVDFATSAASDRSESRFLVGGYDGRPSRIDSTRQVIPKST